MEESSTKQAIICNRSSALCYQTTGMGSAMPVSTSEHPRAGFPRCHHQQLAHLGPGTNLPAAGKSPFPAQGLGWRFKPTEGIYCEIWRVWAGWKSLRVLRYLCKRLVFGVPSKNLEALRYRDDNFWSIQAPGCAHRDHRHSWKKTKNLNIMPLVLGNKIPAWAATSKIQGKRGSELYTFRSLAAN